MSLPEQPSGAEEFLDAQIQIADPSPAVEKTVHDTLDAQPGVSRVTLEGDLVTILYDPTFTTAVALAEALSAAGVAVKHSETHRESPLAEIEDQVEPYLEHGPDPSGDR